MEQQIKITYKKIAEMINKSEAGIKYIAKTNPNLLEILKLGCETKLKNCDHIVPINTSKHSKTVTKIQTKPKT